MNNGAFAGNVAFVTKAGEHPRIVGWIAKESGRPVSAGRTGGAGLIAWQRVSLSRGQGRPGSSRFGRYSS